MRYSDYSTTVRIRPDLLQYLAVQKQHDEASLTRCTYCSMSANRQKYIDPRIIGFHCLILTMVPLKHRHKRYRCPSANSHGHVRFAYIVERKRRPIAVTKICTSPLKRSSIAIDVFMFPTARPRLTLKLDVRSTSKWRFQPAKTSFASEGHTHRQRDKLLLRLLAMVRIDRLSPHLSETKHTVALMRMRTYLSGQIISSLSRIELQN